VLKHILQFGAKWSEGDEALGYIPPGVLGLYADAILKRGFRLPVVPGSGESDRQRLAAWQTIVDHPIFGDCLDSRDTLIGAMMSVLDGVSVPVPADRETLHNSVEVGLDDALLCTRVWEAWAHGTMTEDDFTRAAEDEAFVAQIVDTVIDAGLPVPVYEYGVRFGHSDYRSVILEPDEPSCHRFVNFPPLWTNDQHKINPRAVRRVRASEWEPVPVGVDDE